MTIRKVVCSPRQSPHKSRSNQNNYDLKEFGDYLKLQNWMCSMNQNHYAVELLLREKRRELFKESRIASQMKLNEAESQVNINLSELINRVKLVFIPGKIEMQTAISDPDVATPAECQAC